MKISPLTLAAAAGSAYAQQSAYGRCGGIGYTGATSCVSGYACHTWQEYYAQCTPTSTSAGAANTAASVPVGTASSAPSVSAVTANTGASVRSGTASAGEHTSSNCTVLVTGSGHRTKTTAAGTGYSPVSAGTSYSSVVTMVTSVSSSSVASASTAATEATSTASAASSYSSAASTSAVSTSAASSSVASTTTTSAASTSSSAASSGVVSYAGVNIAGFDFGCSTDGTCDLSSTENPGTTGIDQMKHFVTDDGLNAFRLPVAWQYLVNNDLGGTLDATNFGNYNDLVQGCLNAGADMCIIDIHNYARWNGNIIGQGGPTNAQFSSLWSQLATKYKSNSKVTFGIMNEPHDLDITTWATSVQHAVTAIRKAGATTQKILLPGTEYTSAAEFISDGSASALLNVTNLDGSTTDLIFDVHQYLDSDNSGTSATCVTNHVADFQTLGKWLRTNSRKAMLSETGGGSDSSSCLTDVCQELAELNTYSDVFLGWTGWAAGMFATSYVLSETPDVSGTTYTDQPLVKQCIAGKFKTQS